MSWKKSLFTVALAVMAILSLAGCSNTPSQPQPGSGQQQPGLTQQPSGPTQQSPGTTQQQPGSTQQQPGPTQQPAPTPGPTPTPEPTPTPQLPTPIPQPTPLPQPSLPDDEGELTAEITSSYGLEINDGDDSFSGTIVVKVTNGTSDDAEDIGLELSVEADHSIPDVDEATLTGGGVTWTFDDQDDNILYFSNSTGFDVAEGIYKKMTLTLKVKFEDDVTRDISFEPSVKITELGKLAAVVTSTSGLEIDDGDKSFSGTIVVRVTNGTSDDAEDIELELSLEANHNIPDVDEATLTGGSVSWTFDDQDDNVLYFSNSSGFDVDEGNYKKMTLTLKVKFEDDVTRDISFEPSVKITDYD